MLSHLYKLAANLLSNVGTSQPIEEQTMKANIAVFCASLLTILINAKLDLYFFQKIMTRSRPKHYVARHYLQSVMVLYACWTLTP